VLARTESRAACPLPGAVLSSRCMDVTAIVPQPIIAGRPVRARYTTM
jgi:hypothetical protein